MKAAAFVWKALSVFPLSLLLLCCLCPADVAADAGVKKNWAFRNDGDFYYEDTIGSDLGDTGIVRAVSGVDINILPIRNGNVNCERTVTIALLDTGVDIRHPDLISSIWTNEEEIPDDGIDNDGNGFIDDVHGWNFYNDSASVYNPRSYSEDAHGTHCAGLMCADNPEEIVGVAGGVSSVKIMPVKVVGGADRSGSVKNFIEGIRYAQANGADICSLSLGMEKENSELKRVMQESNMLFVVPACNGEAQAAGRGMSLDSAAWYPACFGLDNVVVAANLQCDGTLHYSSNFSSKIVDIAAPGTQIYSTSTAKGGYEYMSGTSMAVPFVAAALALVHAQESNRTLLETKEILLSHAKRYENLMGYVKDGKVIDVYAALMQTGDEGKSEEPPVVTKKVTGVTLNKTELTLTIGGSSTLKATVAPADATDKTVTWTSSNTKVASVSKNGKVSAKGAGKATITVTTNDGSKTAACVVAVKKKATTITLEPKTVKYTGKSIAISKATVNGSKGEVKYYYYTDSACKKQIKEANVKNAGTYYVIAKVAADDNYAAAASNKVKLVIKQKAGKVSAKNQTVSYNKVKKARQTVKLNAKTTAGKMTYAVKSFPKGMKKFVTVSTKGKVTIQKGAKKGKYVITITAAATKNVTKATGNVTITVK